MNLRHQIQVELILVLFSRSGLVDYDNGTHKGVVLVIVVSCGLALQHHLGQEGPRLS